MFGGAGGLEEQVTRILMNKREKRWNENFGGLF
jgi:hypothetical protein